MRKAHFISHTVLHPRHPLDAKFVTQVFVLVTLQKHTEIIR
jgi:hypothetical protein